MTPKNDLVEIEDLSLQISNDDKELLGISKKDIEKLCSLLYKISQTKISLKSILKLKKFNLTTEVWKNINVNDQFFMLKTDLDRNVSFKMYKKTGKNIELNINEFNDVSIDLYGITNFVYHISNENIENVLKELLIALPFMLKEQYNKVDIVYMHKGSKTFKCEIYPYVLIDDGVSYILPKNCYSAGYYYRMTIDPYSQYEELIPPGNPNNIPDYHENMFR